MKNSVKILNSSNRLLLFEYSLEERSFAYQKMEELELMGLDVELLIPSNTHTLMSALGGSEEDRQKLDQELAHEIDSHGTTRCSPCLPLSS